MDNIFYDYINGTFTIEYEGDIVFNEVDDEQTLSFVNISMEYIKSFIMVAEGITANRFLTVDMKISRDGNNWTDWIDLRKTVINHPPLDPKKKYYVHIRFVRKGSNTKGAVTLKSFKLSGNIERKIFDGESTINLKLNEPTLIKPPFIYKVFKITDIEILTNNLAGVDIKYRYSQDYGRTVSEWEPLTKENISTLDINPTRFFQIEYLLTANMNNVKVFDINLIGDFQNVSKDYKKTNLYGLRENCSCLMLCLIDGKPDGSGGNGSGTGGGAALVESFGTCDTATFLAPLTTEQKAQLYDPYNIDETLNLIATLSSDIAAQWGHQVVYFVTDPDANGIDHTFHEYQLYNYICDDFIKVVVDQNNFPSNEISFNQFDLDLFNAFEVHIVKKDFKETFGVEKRPSKNDYLWFCKLNILYEVEQAQPVRTINNASYYYKVFLKKYSPKANTIGVNKKMNERINSLIQNATIDQLIGEFNDNDKAAVANKDQLKPMTVEPIRNEYKCDIYQHELWNSSNLISETYYDFSTIRPLNKAVIYKNIKNTILVSDNLAYTSWFNFNNFNDTDTYSLFNYYDTELSEGFQLSINDNMLIFKLNETVYEIAINYQIQNQTWYSIVFNINNRQQYVEAFLYKRNVDFEEDAERLPNPKLKLVWSAKQNITIQEMNLEDQELCIFASDMSMTNIRLFSNVIEAKAQSNILNQTIIGSDAKDLILADNANKKLILPFYNMNSKDSDLPDSTF